ncbi:BTB/POZ domain-containing protein 2, partial [Stegodyphus mimosarum]
MPAKKSPIYYVIIDFRHEKLHSHYYKGTDVDASVGRSSFLPSQRRVVLIRAKFYSKHCLPTKVKRSDSGIAWRRKNSSKSKHPQRKSSTPPSARPTLLLPPMRCTAGGLRAEENCSTAPVVTTRVQHGEHGRQPLDSFNTQPLPEPSAPSPGHLFYNSEDHSDITFIVGQEEWRFPAHSFILGKTQPTFLSLLRAASSEKQYEEIRSRFLRNENMDPNLVPPVILKLPDMQPDVFEQILRYIYTNQVSFSTVDSTLRLLHPSQVYHLPQLTSHCLSHISKNVNPSNVLMVLSHLLCPEVHHPSINFSPITSLKDNSSNEENHENDNERNELVFKCFLLVDHHADEVLQSEYFETLEHELMVEIVKRDTLEVSSEAIVFDSVMRWACRACKKQRKELTSDNKCSVLGKALFLVRYLVMTPEEFLRGPVSQGVLSKEDKELFLSRLTTHNSSPQISLPDRWSTWKIAVKRQNYHSLLPVTSPHSELPSSNTDMSVSPSNSIQ